jgi:hypothetical protein
MNNVPHAITNGKMSINKKWQVLLVVLFCIVHVGLLLNFGIYTQEEAVKYSYEADYFLEHAWFSEPKYIFYSGYIFLRIVCNAIGAGDVGMYIVQLLLNALAVVCFYKLVQKLSDKYQAAVFGTLLLILCIPYQKWTAYLFTESIFFSLVIIYTYVLFASFKNRYAKPALATLLLLLLVVSRPTGMLVIPATVAFISYHLFVNKKKLWAFVIWLPGVAGLLLLVDAAMKGKGEFDFIKPFVEEHIICGVPERIATAAAGNGDSLRVLLMYIGQHFFDFIQLAFLRLISFFGLYRSYYSPMHNLLLIAGFYPIYILSTFSIRYMYRNASAFFIFSVVLVITFALSVMLTCDDWHNRFIMPVMPVIFIYAAVGGSQLYEAIVRKRGRT